MLKVISIACILLFPVQILTGQVSPNRSIAEVSTLLQKSKVDSERVSLLLESALLYVMKTGMDRNDFDSALFFVNQAMKVSKTAKNPVWQARCFVVYSQLYREDQQNEKAKKYIESAITVFDKNKKDEDLADAYMELIMFYDIYSDSGWVIKVKYAELAERLYQKTGNILKQARTLKHLGDFYQIEEKDSIALKILNAALAIYQSIPYQEVQGVYDLIGYIFLRAGNYHESLRYGLLAVATAERLKTDRQELSTIYNRVGMSYSKLTWYEDAIKFFNKALPLALEYKDTLGAMEIAINNMVSYYRLGNPQGLIELLQRTQFIYDKGDLFMKVSYTSWYARAYLLTDDTRKAGPFVDELIRLVSDTTDNAITTAMCKAIIPYYLAIGNFQEAQKYLPIYERICLQNKSMIGMSDTYLWWYKADSALGNDKAAINHYKLYKKANDSLLRFTANQQVNQLMIQHESLQKDQAIAAKENNILLLTNEAKLQESQLRQTRILKNLTFGMLALLLIIMALLYNRYQIKQRLNRALELEQKEIAKQNHSLHHLVTEKEWLLKEIHHRVKNNLQIVMSLLNSQSAYIENAAARTAIHDSQHRVHAMSLIHQKLYSSENVSSIDMSFYIRELASYLQDSFDTGQRIRFEYDIEPLNMDVSQAVPLGLILNEAITNSIKYAFPDIRDGVINITLSNTAPHHYLLCIADNGIGMPADFAGKKTGSLGMSLMAGLSEDLEGSFAIENNKGTTIKISFVHDMNVRRSDILVSSSVYQ